MLRMNQELLKRDWSKRVEDILMENIAHVKHNIDGTWSTQNILEHSNNVAKLSSLFAGSFGNEDWGYLCGKIHDIGKIKSTWQGYIRNATGYNNDSPIEDSEKGNHSTAGAILILDKFYSHKNQVEKLKSLLLAYIIAGHHAGLLDYNEGEGASLTSRIFKSATEIKNEELNQINCSDEEKKLLDIELPITKPAGGKINYPEHMHLWIRMLFSSLVDADYLDTEAFMYPELSELRGNYPTITELKDRFDVFMSEMAGNAPDTYVNRQRNYVLQQCIEKGKDKPGFFSLTVPTGGGKTLSAMAFALEHALTHNKDRIIMAIPYTSIIEQTAKVYKYGSDEEEKIKNNIEKNKILFGEENVLEHHSNVDTEQMEYKNILASQNWDAPVIVTTNVELLQSLHASRPSSCRKLHNITNSIIILDEAQMLPPEYMEAIVSTLRGLVESFGVTVLLCTATQPALTGKIGSSMTSFKGIEYCKEIIENPAELMETLNRVKYQYVPAEFDRSLSWEEISKELTKENQVLCIVNTRRDCRELYSFMPEGTIHLSGYMCHEEISDLISEIKQKLLSNEPVRVISTQLVEAGVDIDFPVVWRALAGMDSIAQAAGRCNREGKLTEKGRVVIFLPPNPLPGGNIKIAAQVTDTMLKNINLNGISPQTFKDYFSQFYAFQHSLDKPDFKTLLVNGAMDGIFQFRTFASQFKIIDDSGQQGIFVQYVNNKKDPNNINGERSGKELIGILRKSGPSRKLMSKLQRFTVNVPKHVFNKLYKDGAIETVQNYFVLADCFYQNGMGVVLDGNAIWTSNDYFL